MEFIYQCNKCSFESKHVREIDMCVSKISHNKQYHNFKSKLLYELNHKFYIIIYETHGCSMNNFIIALIAGKSLPDIKMVKYLDSRLLFERVLNGITDNEVINKIKQCYTSGRIPVDYIMSDTIDFRCEDS